VVQRLLVLVLPVLAGLALAAPFVARDDADVRRGPPVAIALSGPWQLARDPSLAGSAGRWYRGGVGVDWEPATVPGVNDLRTRRVDQQGSVVWYRLRFRSPRTPAGFGWAVHFGGVRGSTRAWLDGRSIGSAGDDYAPFALPATGLRGPGGDHVLVLRVDGRRFHLPPQGWWNWSGIVAPVTLVPLGRMVLDGVGVLPELRCRDSGSCTRPAVVVDGWLRNRSGARLRPRVALVLRSPTGATTRAALTASLLAPGASEHVRLRVAVRGRPRLWSPADPARYDAVVTTAVGGRVPQLQQVDRLKIGLRSVTVAGGALRLNGRRLALHGVSLHEDMPGRGPALTDADITTLIAEVQALHANVVRAHYLLDERLLARLDAAGIMVWCEPAVWRRNQLLRRRSGRAQALANVRATMLACRNHPAVIADSVGNEVGARAWPGTRRYLRAAQPLARALDPAVPVAIDLPTKYLQRPDSLFARFPLIGLNAYFGWYEGRTSDLLPWLRKVQRRYPRSALVLDEFGAEAFRNGAATSKGSYAFQARWVGQTLDLAARARFLDGEIYFALRDFQIGPGWTGGAVRPASNLMHTKGLLAYDGRRKPSWSVVEQRFARLPTFVR
jgi:Glycosyl hydrolases family 2, TIM barrel domain